VSRLRDRIMPAWVRQSEWLGKLRWHEQSLFYGLWNWVDDNGVFEARASVLRGGLYSTMMGKVSVGEIEQMLRRLHELGVIKLYTVGGKGYGRIVEFKQKMKFHRAEHPLPPDMQGELGFTVPVTENAQADAPSTREVFEPKSLPKKVSRNRSPERMLRELREELNELRKQIDEIERPGGAAWRTEPSAEKKPRYDKLVARRSVVRVEIEKLEKLIESEEGEQ